MQEESRRTSQQHLDQKVNSEAQRSSSLVAQLRAMVADREAKVQQLELEIGQLSVQVSWVPPGQCVCPQPLPLSTVTSALATASSLPQVDQPTPAAFLLICTHYFLKHKPICGRH